ncbi:exocyst complex component SEC3A-like [Bidens hawaiensis]|uniref:exocyst complex component SEC3A-like n=1 Tax=Bidens hawaiensis TaxID=980011 RepID=UPI00404B035F
MAKSTADDKELRRACEAAIDGTKQKIIMSIRVAKSKGAWGKGKIGKGAQIAKPRVLAVSTKNKSSKTKAFLRVFKYTTGTGLEQAKVYKLKRLGKVELFTNDPTGCTFTLGFDNLKHQRVVPAQWTMRNLDDRNHILVCILNICKDASGHLPKVVGIDIVELALWAKEHASKASKQQNFVDGPSGDVFIEGDATVENELVSQAEEEDMEALLNTFVRIYLIMLHQKVIVYVYDDGGNGIVHRYMISIGEAEVLSERLKRELHALEAANVHAILESEPLVTEVLQGLESAAICVEDMDEWLALFNVKLRHMREDIQAIEARNNKLELQSLNYKSLVVELDKLHVKLHIPSEISDCLAGGSFDLKSLNKYIEACEWLRSASRGIDALDPSYAKARAVKEKRAELDIIKLTFVRLACEFLRDFFVNMVDSLMSDKRNFTQRGKLKAPNHVDIQNKCRTYARLLHHLKILDKSSLPPLRKTYCNSVNQLLRHEAHEFANELRTGTKAPKVQSVWFEGSSAPNINVNTSMVSEAYSKMLETFIPLLVDESSFLSFFMRFEVSTPDPPSIHDEDDEDYLSMMEDDEDGIKGAVDLGALNESLCDLLDGIQDDFFATVEWAHKIDPLLCISMHAITNRYTSDLKSETSGYVRLLLVALEDRISTLFVRFVDDARYQIEKNEKNAKQSSTAMPFIPRFALLATRMEQYIKGQSRDLVDQAYIKIIGVMFVTLDNISQGSVKHPDIFLLENYAAFQNSLYDLANCVPTLAKFYHQASDAYEQSCTRHMSVIIYYEFERLFQFARKVEDLLLTITPEEVPFQVGMSKSDLRKVVKSGLTGVDKHITAMHKKLMKNLTSEELFPILWDKCKKEFLDKYESFAQLATKVYPTENIPSVVEIRDILGSI